MTNTKTFSLDEDTIKKLEQDSRSLHLGKSAFLRFLIWSYDSKGRSNQDVGGWSIMPNDALIEFSKEFGIPVDSPEITMRLIEEISKLKEEIGS